MATRVAVAINTVARPYTNATYTSADATNHHSIAPPSGPWCLHVKLTDSSTKDLTFVTPGTVDGNAIADEVVTIPITSQVFIPSKSIQYYLDPTTHTINFNVSAATGLSFAVICL